MKIIMCRNFMSIVTLIYIVTGFRFKHSLHRCAAHKYLLSMLRLESSVTDVTWRSSTVGNILFNTIKNMSVLGSPETAEYILSLASVNDTIQPLLYGINESLTNYSLALPLVAFFGLRLSPVLRLSIIYHRRRNNDDSLTDQLQFQARELEYSYHEFNDATRKFQSVPCNTVFMKDAITSVSVTSWPKNASKSTCLSVTVNVELVVKQDNSNVKLPVSFVESSGNVILQNYMNTLANRLIRKLPMYLLR